MGLFAIFFSVVIVIIQGTSLLLQREAHKWTFSLVRNEPNISHIRSMNDFMLLQSSKYHLLGAPHNYSNPLENAQLSIDLLTMQFMTMNKSSPNSSSEYYASDRQLACMQMHWKDTPLSGRSVPIHCFFNTHFNQIIEPIMKPINPHIILFVICCVNAVFCLSKLKTSVFQNKKAEISMRTDNEWSIEPNIPFYLSLNYIAGILLLLVVIVFIIQGIENAEYIEYPTIIFSVLLVLFTIWYVVKVQDHKEDSEWVNAFHLQSTAVPLAILALGTLGTRVWNELFIHFALLNATVNILWIENHFSQTISKKVCQFLCFFLPMFSLYLAHIQWGKYDSWKFAILVMSFVCFIPFVLYPIISTPIENEKKLKSFGKLTTFFISASLISLVVNFAMFEEKS